MPTNLTQILSDSGQPNVYNEPVAPNLQPYEDIVKAVDDTVEVINNNRDAESLAGFEAEMSEVKGPGLEWYAAQRAAVDDLSIAQGLGDKAGVRKAEMELDRIETGEVQGQLSPYAAKIRRDQVVAKWSNLRPRIATALRQMASTTHTGTPEMKLTSSDIAMRSLSQQTDALAKHGVDRFTAGQFASSEMALKQKEQAVKEAVWMADNMLMEIPTQDPATGIVTKHNNTVTGFITGEINQSVGYLLESFQTGQLLARDPNTGKIISRGQLRKISDPMFDRENWMAYLESQRSEMKTNIRGRMYSVMRDATSDGKRPFDSRLNPEVLIKKAEADIDAMINQALGVVKDQNVAQRMSWYASARRDMSKLAEDQYLLKMFTPAQLALLRNEPSLFAAVNKRLDKYTGQINPQDRERSTQLALTNLRAESDPASKVAVMFLTNDGWLMDHNVSAFSQPKGSGQETTQDEDNVGSNDPEKKARAIENLSFTTKEMLRNEDPDIRALGANTMLAEIGNKKIVDLISNDIRDPKRGGLAGMLTADTAEASTKTGKKTTAMMANAGTTYIRSNLDEVAFRGNYLTESKSPDRIFDETRTEILDGRVEKPGLDRRGLAIARGNENAYEVAQKINNLYQVIRRRDPSIADRMRSDILKWYTGQTGAIEGLDLDNPQAYLDAQKKEGEAK